MVRHSLVTLRRPAPRCWRLRITTRQGRDTHMTTDTPAPSSSGGRERVKLRQRLLLALASIVLALVLVEVGLRFVGFSFSLYPETIEFGAPNPRQMASDFQPDPDLFWITKDYDDTVLPNARIDRPKLIFTGCSVTHWGFYPGQLEKLMARRYQPRRLSYLNLGIAGYSSHQGRQQLERDIIDIEPEVVTIFFGWNDHWIGYGITDREVARLNSSSLFFSIQRKSRLCQLMTRAFAAKSKREAADYPLRVSPADFEGNLTAMVRLCREHDIVPVLLTAPTSHVQGQEPEYLAERQLKNLEDLVPLHRQYVEIVRRVAASEQAVLCDLTREFERLPREQVESIYFRQDGIHMRPPGDAKIAEFLLNCLEENDLIDRVMH